MARASSDNRRRSRLQGGVGQRLIGLESGPGAHCGSATHHAALTDVVGALLPCASVKPRRKLIGWRGYSARPHRLVNDKRHSVSCLPELACPSNWSMRVQCRQHSFPLCAESGSRRDKQLAGEILQLLASIETHTPIESQLAALFVPSAESDAEPGFNSGPMAMDSSHPS